MSRLLTTLFDDARKVLDDVSVDNVDKNLAFYLNLLVHMENSVLMPSAEMVVCQQVISQCFAVKGNYHVVKALAGPDQNA